MVKGTRRRRGRRDTWARGEMWGRGEKRLTWGAAAPRLLGIVVSDERAAALRGNRGGRGEACGCVVCVVCVVVGECNLVEMEAKPGLWGALGVFGCGDLMLRMLKVLLMKEVILEMVVRMS